MKTNLNNSPRSSRTKGLGLIEVIAAIAILGSVLTAAVLASAKQTQQYATSARKLQATRATDQWLTQQWNPDPGAPGIKSTPNANAQLETSSGPISGGPFSGTLPSTGNLPSDPTFTWSLDYQPNIKIEATGARIARLKIHDTQNPNPNDSEPLVTLDLIVPAPQPINTGINQ